MKEESGEGDHKDHAELVNGGHFGGKAKLKGPEITDPREAGGDSGQGEEDPGFFEIAANVTGFFDAATMNQVQSRTTVVRIAVARFELMPSTPTFARIAVAAAKRAERTDQSSQLVEKAPMETISY